MIRDSFRPNLLLPHLTIRSAFWIEANFSSRPISDIAGPPEIAVKTPAPLRKDDLISEFDAIAAKARAEQA